VAPGWAGICIALAVIVDIVGGIAFGDSMITSVLSDALLIVGFGGVAWVPWKCVLPLKWVP
jgi:hypothetical protein